ATAYGVRCLGPANPSHHDRLKRYAKLARKRGREQQEKADLEVRMMPVRYAFAQEVTLYRRGGGTSQPGGGRGGRARPPRPPPGTGGGAMGAASGVGGGGGGGGGWPPPRYWSTATCSWDRPPTRWRRTGWGGDDRDGKPFPPARLPPLLEFSSSHVYNFISLV